MKTILSSKLLQYIVQHHRKLIIILGIALWLFTRFYNFEERLYFIYDQGRDALQLQKIVEGDFTLIGPTSGLQGFFLGPLWYYVGVPGFLLGNGNPYSISLWYVLLGSLSVPLFWFMSNSVLKRPWSYVSFLLLIAIPGSIWWSIFIWNPLISIPLMCGVFICLIKARTSNLSLFFAFFLLALTLQSEFAYAIFFIPPLVLLIPWIKQRVRVMDFVVAGVAGGITLLPQLLFDLRNNFLLTNSLFSGVSSDTNSIGLLETLAQRPAQLFNTVESLFFSDLFIAPYIMMGVLCLLFFAIYSAFQKSATKKQDRYSQQLLAILAVIPFIGYLFWSGNNGYFFDYYLTPHFVFLVPLLVFGIQNVFSMQNTLALFGKLIAAIVLICIVIASYNFNRNFILLVNNEVGLQQLEKMIVQVFDRIEQEDYQNPAFLIYTPNIYTEQYDYLISWIAKRNQVAVPRSQRQGSEDSVFLLMEKEEKLYAERFVPWYASATENAVLKQRSNSGPLVFEWWEINSQ